MLTSIATVSVSGTLEEKLQAIAAAGFDGVEIFENDLIAFPGSPAEVGKMIDDLGLRCTMFQPFRDFEGMPQDQRARIFERAERKFQTMEELGTDLLLVCSNVSPASSGDRARIVDDFRTLGGRAGERGLRIGFEALAWGAHVNDHRDAWAIVREVAHPAVGLVLDSFHSLARRIPIESLHSIDAAKIFIVQLADAPWLEMDFLSWSRHFRNLPGQGDIPVRAFVSALLEIGYDGPLSLEIFNDQFRSIPANVAARDGLRSLRLTIDESARAIGLKHQAAIPPRVQSQGLEFVEFAVNDAERDALSKQLLSLGFAETGRHRSKAVNRWTQGSINLLLNADPEGFAHSHNLVHGPSVCALGMRVRDVPASLARASALSIANFEGRVGRGEMKIPAIRDVGGSLIYLIEDGSEQEIWARDFVPLADRPAARDGAGLIAVDHIAYAMSNDELLSWQLYNFALFDLDKPPLVEVPDPRGLVQSQAMANADRALRLVLNGSASPETLTARLRDRYWGSGVQSISFSTSDIFATARRLAVLGLDVVEIPANYYDNLEIRFDLSPGEVDRLRECHILYDEDPSGKYYQLFSRAYEKRFFFEIVERRGYDGYGVSNEPIKWAAQSRFREAPGFGS
jgi:4-hydroxyphenylpyruvate dioxygenase